MVSWLCVQFPEGSLDSSHRVSRARARSESKEGLGAVEQKQSAPWEMICVHGNEGKLEDGFALRLKVVPFGGFSCASVGGVGLGGMGCEGWV